MAVTAIPVYCVEADVRRLFSAAGVLAFSDHDQDGLSDDDVIDDCIEQGSDEITLRLNHRYNPEDLQSTRLVTRWATVLAVYFLCYRRGNPVPESIDNEFHRLMDPDGLLDRIAKGKDQLPGVSLRCDLRPTWSNLKVDRRWPTSKTRVSRVNSSDAPTDLTQDTKWEGGGYDI